ncbi:MAG TPA: cation:proton antiporter [Gemmatimonadales bacterium]|nr:cation:proton antiporter [Gemmatimonadales bacterium]
MPAVLATLGSAADTGHGAVGPLLIGLVVILTAARLAGELARRAGQPAVLGELLVGILLGNLHRLGIGWFQGMASDPILNLLAQLGVIILLFEVGLESTVRDMMRVGMTATFVAVLGVVTPFALGWGVGVWMLPGHSVYVHVFLGATLTATSVGITARVLRELGKSQTPEARVILGAAVVDDILGLVILAVVAGAIGATNMGQSLSLGPVAMVLLKAGLFLGGALALGTWLAPRLFHSAARLRGQGALLTTAIVFCFALAYLASVVGLAPIVGAYAAGLVLESVQWRDFTARGEHELEELIEPVATLLVPVFFVLMGMHVDLAAFARTEVLGLAALLTIAAIIGKQACALGAGGGLNRLAIGIGMVPRGEVGLIFAGIGLTLSIGGEPVIDQAVFSAIVIMVIVTTMITPQALKWSLARTRGPSAAQAASPS